MRLCNEFCEQVYLQQQYIAELVVVQLQVCSAVGCLKVLNVTHQFIFCSLFNYNYSEGFRGMLSLCGLNNKHVKIVPK